MASVVVYTPATVLPNLRQKVEHYEIATFGSLVQLARTIGNEDIAIILEATLKEEKETDQGLTFIAENDINWEAEQEGAAGEESGSVEEDKL